MSLVSNREPASQIVTDVAGLPIEDYTPNDMYWVYAMLDEPQVVPKADVTRRHSKATIKNGIVVKPLNRGEAFSV